MTAALLERASSGDEAAFRELTDPLRGELEFHCYRMLGSRQDAEDVLQETMLAAWRSLGSFQWRSSLRTWLYRIATNRCLNALRDAHRQPPAPPTAPFSIPPPTRTADPQWLEAYPEDRLGWLADTAPGPAARYESREAVEITFIPRSSTCPAASARCSSSATYSASTPMRRRRCSARRSMRSRARSSAPGPR
jgi:RNA polymerase sigma factor (sigma-70 family)